MSSSTWITSFVFVLIKHKIVQKKTHLTEVGSKLKEGNRPLVAPRYPQRCHENRR
jgi:hypothetical protein